MSYQLLLVEDDPKIREGILDYFSGQGTDYQLECAINGLEGLQKIQENHYDLLLLDVMLPGMNGFSLLQTIRRNSDVPVIFMTAKIREEDRLYGYELGCDDYVCKPFLISELYAKVGALLRRSGGTVIDDTVRCGAVSVNKRTLIVRVNGEEKELAPKELALLMVLLERKNWVFTRAQLLDRVWGPDYTGVDRVVDNHIKKLRKSLGSAGNQIKTVISRGYKMTE